MDLQNKVKTEKCFNCDSTSLSLVKDLNSVRKQYRTTN